MNRVLLAKVRDRIAEVGNEGCNMALYADGTVRAAGDVCGSTACIAGWAMAIHHGSWIDDGESPWREACQLLGFPSREVFHVDFWPEHYARLLDEEGDAKGMLAVCDALLDGALTFNSRGDLVELA